MLLLLKNWRCVYTCQCHLWNSVEFSAGRDCVWPCTLHRVNGCCCDGEQVRSSSPWMDMTVAELQEMAARQQQQIDKQQQVLSSKVLRKHTDTTKHLKMKWKEYLLHLHWQELLSKATYRAFKGPVHPKMKICCLFSHPSNMLGDFFLQ